MRTEWLCSQLSARSTAGLIPTSGEKEKAIEETSWHGHAFFYKSARAVAGCDDSEQRQRLRRLKQDNPVPEFKDWLLGKEHPRRPSGAGPEAPPKSLRLRVRGGADCVIRELCQDAQVLQQTERPGVPYRTLSRTAPGRSQL